MYSTTCRRCRLPITRPILPALFLSEPYHPSCLTPSHRAEVRAIILLHASGLIQ